MYGRRLPKAELFARIDAVDEAAVKAVAARFLLDQDLAVAAMGDTQVGGVRACVCVWGFGSWKKRGGD